MCSATPLGNVEHPWDLGWILTHTLHLRTYCLAWYRCVGCFFAAPFLRLLALFWPAPLNLRPWTAARDPSVSSERRRDPNTGDTGGSPAVEQTGMHTYTVPPSCVLLLLWFHLPSDNVQRLFQSCHPHTKYIKKRDYWRSPMTSNMEDAARYRSDLNTWQSYASNNPIIQCLLPIIKGPDDSRTTFDQSNLKGCVFIIIVFPIRQGIIVRLCCKVQIVASLSLKRL